MILIKTPVRITLFGGGSDYQEFFLNNPGRTLSLSINKYSYLAINQSPIFSKKKFFIGYSKVELKNKICEIQHPSIRACLDYFNLHNERLQIHYFADLPAKTGLGSSSAFTVSLIKAICKYKKKNLSNLNIAYLAIKIEKEIIKENVGCQDQLTTSIGGLLDIKYTKKKFLIKKNFITKQKIFQLSSNLMLFYSGFERYSSQVLSGQIKKIKTGKNDIILKKMVSLCNQSIEILKKKKTFDEIGYMLNENWLLKKKLSNHVTNKKIDEIYEIAINSGALGGKLIGAGAGGFFLFYVPKHKQKIFSKKLNFLHQVNFFPEFGGCKII